jgi:hypothetical protein
MVDQSLAEQRQWAESEVERLETNLTNLKSLNASKIGIQMAEEELDKAMAALAALTPAPEAAPAEETHPETAGTEPTPSEPASDEPVEESPQTSEQQPVEESPLNQEPESEPVSEEPADVASEPASEEPAAEVAVEETPAESSVEGPNEAETPAVAEDDSEDDLA